MFKTTAVQIAAICILSVLCSGCVTRGRSTRTAGGETPESAHPPEFWADIPEERMELPDWIVRYPDLLHRVEPGDQVEWELLARSTGSEVQEETGWPTYAAARLPVTGDSPLAITAVSERGYPVIMISDRPLHTMDPYAPIVEGEQALPAHPIAFALGGKGRCTVNFVSPCSALYQVWVWVLHGPLLPPVTVDFSELEEGGEYFDGLDHETLEMLQAMSRQPDVVRAWQAREVDKGENDWRYSEITLSVRPAPAGDVAPGDLLVNWRSKNRPEPEPGEISGFAEIWRRSLEETAHNKGRALDRGRSWKAASYSFSHDFENSFLLKILMRWADHPSLAGVLLQREHESGFFASREAADRFFNAQRGIAGGEASILSSSASKLLSGLLVHTGGADAALLDVRGNLIAATSAFLISNPGDSPLWEDFAWDEFPPGGFAATSPYLVSGSDYALIKVMVPVKHPDEHRVLGWLAAEVYGE